MNQFAITRRRGGRAHHSGNGRSGLSLLEVILSIAILGGAMVMIGNLYFVGYRAAVQAKFRSDANILADAKMAELAAGVLPIESSAGSEIEGSPGWTYSVDIQPSLQNGLFMATVIVMHGTSASETQSSVTIVRFIPDPDYEPEEDQE